ncbi:7993_t:CDS:2 [Scutellospora calospora]|uniref:7993_t:CDS:1 n=1 Tax=Scutellospora calospora TaxID=85575 RepID=A0ACA9L9H0_9GLOM|nr:7993_t:CDS:2 [Scutellospora calospora]
MKIDTRITTLGHIKRGGSPCVYDRCLATIQSVEAVEAALRATPDIPSPMIGIRANKITCEPLMDAVKLTHQGAEAIKEKNFRRAMEDDYETYLSTTLINDNAQSLQGNHSLKIGIIHVGAPTGGMNAATRVAVRFTINRDHKPIAIYNGLSGGSELGTNKTEVDDLGMVAFQLQKQGINALLIIGSFKPILL